MRVVIAFLCLTCPTVLFAQDCPPVRDHSAELTRLIEGAQSARNEMGARGFSDQMWGLWLDAPNAKAQELLDKGMQQRRLADYEKALLSFDALVAYCPDFAEGYNQRAFVNFLSQDYEAALRDLDLAIDRAPRHIAALSGKALSLIGLKRDREAQVVLREALRLNPWLSERRFLLETSEQEL